MRPIIQVVLNPASDAPLGELPLALRSWWGLAALVAIPFHLRLLYEQTVLTWRFGEQSVGFGIADAYPGFFLLGIAGSVALGLWLLVATFVLILRRRWPRQIEWLYFLLPLALFGLTAAPYRFWASLGGIKIT